MTGEEILSTSASNSVTSINNQVVKTLSEMISSLEEGNEIYKPTIQSDRK